MNIIDHLEKNLGEIEQGWSLTGKHSNIQAVSFRNQPFVGSVTYATIGLSNFILPMLGGRTVRQELIFSTYLEYPSDDVSSFILTFGNFIKDKNQALLRGDVVGPSSPIIAGVKVNAIYASHPVIFNDDLNVFRLSEPPTVIIWLLPLHSSEALFVKSAGWENFEDILEINNPDLLDLKRNPLIL